MPLLALPRPLLFWLIISSSAFAAAVDAVNQTLDHDLLPLIEQRCISCHDADTKKGDISFEFLRHPGATRHDIRLWGKVREQIRAGTMPPKAKPPLEAPQRDLFLHWIQSNENAVLEMPATQPGPARSRRLNREEYSNTLRDLLGIAKRPGDKFPADGAGGEGFANNADTLSLSPLLIEKYLGAAEEAIAEAWQRGDLRQRLIAPVTSDKLPPDTGAELALRPFLIRAFRRPPAEPEVQALLTVFRQAWQRKPSWDDAMKVMFKAALVTPAFLFIEETARTGTPQPRPLTSYEMASHLSYFLWSSMPDEELLRLAAENKLQDDAILDSQARRMLVHEKGLAFTENFAGQWLRFDQVFNTVDPDRRKFPDFNGDLRQAMYDEIFAFCDHLLRHNGRVLDFLDSDYSFLNEPLAKVYEVPGVQGKEMRQVKFPNSRRGGLTSMAAILATTAYPQRTSPVLRGKWVLEQLLGTPPPPPACFHHPPTSASSPKTTAPSSKPPCAKASKPIATNPPAPAATPASIPPGSPSKTSTPSANGATPKTASPSMPPASCPAANPSPPPPNSAASSWKKKISSSASSAPASSATPPAAPSTFPTSPPSSASKKPSATTTTTPSLSSSPS